MAVRLKSFCGRYARPRLNVFVLAMLTFAGMVPRSPAIANEPVPRFGDISIHERAELVDVVRDEIEWMIAQQQPIDGQGSELRLLDVTLVAETNSAVVNLTSDFVQHGYDYIGGCFEDQMHQLALAAWEAATGRFLLTGVEFLYDGKDIYHYFPDERPEVVWERARQASSE